MAWMVSCTLDPETQGAVVFLIRIYQKVKVKSNLGNRFEMISPAGILSLSRQGVDQLLAKIHNVRSYRQ